MTEKLKVEDMHCFNGVVKAIGKTAAKCELFKVLQSKDSYWELQGKSAMMDDPLTTAFHWKHTPQGHNFWKDIADSLITEDW